MTTPTRTSRLAHGVAVTGGWIAIGLIIFAIGFVAIVVLPGVWNNPDPLGDKAAAARATHHAAPVTTVSNYPAINGAAAPPPEAPATVSEASTTAEPATTALAGPTTANPAPPGGYCQRPSRLTTGATEYVSRQIGSQGIVGWKTKPTDAGTAWLVPRIFGYWQRSDPGGATQVYDDATGQWYGVADFLALPGQADTATPQQQSTAFYRLVGLAYTAQAPAC